MSKIREVLKNEQRLVTEVPLYKRDGTLSYQVFIARCPSLNCPNTVRIEKIKQIEVLVAPLRYFWTVKIREGITR